MKTYISTILIALGLALVSPLYASEVTGTLCTGLNCSIESTVIAAPVASPAAGTYTSAQSVTLTAAGATSIRYTTNGSTPTCSDTTYSSAISVSATTTIKAISCYPNSVTSSVASFAYTINIPSSGGGGGGGPIITTYACRDREATNYKETGTSKPSLCTYAPADTDDTPIVILPPVKPVFSDIAGSFASANILSFAQRGILKGYADGTFRPNSPITRAEFLAVTMKALGITVPATSTSSFTDVRVAWMIPYVEAAKSLGIAKGQMIDEVPMFRPNDSITRAEAIAILLNAAEIGVNSSLTTTEFSDVTVEWMIPYVETAKSLGIAKGQIIDGLLKFRPNDSITRAESVQIIANVEAL